MFFFGVYLICDDKNVFVFKQSSFFKGCLQDHITWQCIFKRLSWENPVQRRASSWLAFLIAMSHFWTISESYKEDITIEGRNKTVPTATLPVQSHISSKRMKAETEQKLLSWSLTVEGWQGWTRLLTCSRDPCL